MLFRKDMDPRCAYCQRGQQIMQRRIVELPVLIDKCRHGGHDAERFRDALTANAQEEGADRGGHYCTSRSQSTSRI